MNQSSKNLPYTMTQDQYMVELLAEAMVDLLKKKNIEGTINIKMKPPGIEVEMNTPQGWISIIDYGIRGACQLRDNKKEIQQ